MKLQLVLTLMLFRVKFQLYQLVIQLIRRLVPRRAQVPGRAADPLRQQTGRMPPVG